MCCPMCVFNHLHDGHRVIEINNIETLNKENITIFLEIIPPQEGKMTLFRGGGLFEDE